MHLDFNTFNEEGLFLVFDDGRVLRLTRPVIEAAAQSFERDPSLIPEDCRQAAAFAPCGICPMKDVATYCHALPTVFPFLGELDRFLSHDKVTAVYRAPADDGDPAVFQVTRTSMQRALQHVAIISLMYYCEIGLHYARFFRGIVPFMDAVTLAERLYANILIAYAGDRAEVDRTAEKLREELTFTIHCQIARLRMVCRNDAFINAFTGLHTALTCLAPEMRQLLRDRNSAR